MKQTVRVAIDNAFATISKSSKSEPPAPPEQNCRGCPCGLPRLFVRGKSETILHGDTMPVHGFDDSQKRLWHSDCGDRFGWIPPHEKKEQLTAGQ
jgi:hypothetical protein